MTKKELLEELKDYPDNTEVVIQDSLDPDCDPIRLYEIWYIYSMNNGRMVKLAPGVVVWKDGKYVGDHGSG